MGFISWKTKQPEQTEQPLRGFTRKRRIKG